MSTPDRQTVVLQALPKGSGPQTIIEATRRAALAAGLDWLQPGQSVFVKLAANSARPYPATTSPLAVSALVGLLRERGAGRVLVGDKPGVESVHQDQRHWRGRARQVLTASGLHQAIVEAGGEPCYFDEAGQEGYLAQAPAGPNHWRGPLWLPKVLTEVDHLVLLPRVSRHVLAGTTLGLKVGVGWLRDDSRLELHRDAASFFAKIAEINQAPLLRDRLRLTLSLAGLVQTTFGPDKGHVAEPDPGLVLASRDLLAHDMVDQAWLLWCRQRHTPKGRLAWFNDPYISAPSLFNRLFVGVIWGLGAFLASQGYSAPPLGPAAQDPILAAYAGLRGGWPSLELADLEGSLPAELGDFLARAAAGPGRGE